jgi:hypothetical protein
MAFKFQDIDFPVREDLCRAYREAWQRLAHPGNWWTAAERIAIAAESRNALDCPLCRQRKDPILTYPVEGNHQHLNQLPYAAVDVIHRVVSDTEGINGKWINGILSSGLSDGQYVELLGIVVMVFSIDEFNRAIGAAPQPLPEPGTGPADNYRPPNLETETGFVPMIPADGNTGKEADLWHKGRTGNVIRALSLVPDAVRDLLLLSDAQYISHGEIMAFRPEAGRAIDRMQIELVAGRVSALNECFY